MTAVRDPRYHARVIPYEELARALDRWRGARAGEARGGEAPWIETAPDARSKTPPVRADAAADRTDE